MAAVGYEELGRGREGIDVRGHGVTGWGELDFALKGINRVSGLGGGGLRRRRSG